MKGLLAAIVLIPAFAQAQALTADEIMRRAAENQARSQVERKKYVYDMNVFVRLQRAKGKLAREESRDYVVAPGEKGARRKLTKIEGKIFDGKKEIPYTDPKFRYKGVDIDGDLTDAFAGEVMWRKGELGPTIDWFPLSLKRLSHYTFRLTGEERYRDYDVYRIEFENHEPEDDMWKGEALIEKNEFQPVLVTNAWTGRIPTAVKALLGTNVTQVGAKITYQRFDKDVWFPVICGGEIKLKVLFLYSRTIAFRASNSAFRKADVQTSIVFDSDDEEPSQ